jgi:hypothetical protein
MRYKKMPFYYTSITMADENFVHVLLGLESSGKLALSITVGEIIMEKTGAGINNCPFSKKRI